MATDLPLLSNEKQRYSGLGFEQKPHRKLLNSAVHVQIAEDTGNILPNVTGSQTSKRNSEGHVLQVKFAPDVTLAHVGVDHKHSLSAPSLEREKSALNDSVLNVDHQHYEQWARVPGRRAPNSSLLRGIQALKARMKREIMEQEQERERQENINHPSKVLHINTLTKNTLLTRDKLSEESCRRVRDRTVASFPKPNIEPRFPLKANPHIIDAEMFKREDNLEQRKSPDDKQEQTVPKEIHKPRFGIAKIRDRCALPVSVYHPVSIGNHVFLINEPLRYSEYVKLKTRSESKMKKENKSGVNRQSSQQESDVEMPTIESLERSKTFTSGYPTSNCGKRSRVLVSSAELFDFSQLSEIRHSLENKLERSKTEFTFSANKGTKSSKLVPNVRKLKEWFKAS